MKVGVVLVGYNMSEYVSSCLDAWTQARECKIDGHEFVICAVSTTFAHFPCSEADNTAYLLGSRVASNEIDHIITEPKNVPETVARGMALTYLKDHGCDVSWQVDLDEDYTLDEIRRVLEFVVANPWAAWFRLSLKNFVLDSRTYLVDPFTPPRIHRINHDGYRAYGFSADNDISYAGGITRDIKHQDQLPSMTIPQSVAWIKHDSWPNSLRSKYKCEYQKTRWGNSCSFAWDDSQGGLIFNPARPKPKVIRKTELDISS